MFLLKNLVIHISLFFMGRHISPSYLYFFFYPSWVMGFSAVMNRSRDSESIRMNNSYIQETAPPTANYAVLTATQPLSHKQIMCLGKNARSLSHTMNESCLKHKGVWVTPLTKQVMKFEVCEWVWLIASLFFFYISLHDTLKYLTWDFRDQVFILKKLNHLEMYLSSPVVEQIMCIYIYICPL